MIDSIPGFLFRTLKIGIVLGMISLTLGYYFGVLFGIPLIVGYDAIPRALEFTLFDKAKFFGVLLLFTTCMGTISILIVERFFAD